MDELQLRSIQNSINAESPEGWLFFLFRNQNPIAQRILELPPEQVRTRRCFYFVPAGGTPVKLLHRIEPHVLDHLPGHERFYLSHEDLFHELSEILKPYSRIAMEYSPKNAVPYVSLVDGGTIELVRECGVEVESSADLVQQFEAVLDDRQRLLQDEAVSHLNRIRAEAFAFIRKQAPTGELTEYRVQEFIREQFAASGLETEHAPIVAFGSHTGDPHYLPPEEGSAVLAPETVILLDMWAKLQHPEDPPAIYGDITWMGYYGQNPPSLLLEIFSVVREARRTGLELIRKRFAAGIPVRGWEVDQAVREVISRAGFGDAFIHRTGHNIGTEDHGNGAHIDNLETRELRRLIPGTSFSLEPGIYLPEFGVRLEYDVRIEPDNQVIIVGGEEQEELLLLP
jgi:Xaa-Pro aminopeptidase